MCFKSLRGNGCQITACWPRFRAEAVGATLWLARAISPSPVASRTASPSPSPAHHSPHIVQAGTAGSTFWSVDLPAWITAIATVGLLAGAVITAIFAVKAFRKQAREVDLLQKQAERDIYDRRRAQARLVFISLIDPPAEHDSAAAAAQMDAVIRARDETVVQLAATVSNTSRQPVYDVSARWRVGGEPLGDLQVEPQVMPGEAVQSTQSWSASSGITGLSVTLHFSDAAGVRWRTTDRGALAEVCGARGGTAGDRYCGLPPGHGEGHSWDAGRAQRITRRR